MPRRRASAGGRRGDAPGPGRLDRTRRRPPDLAHRRSWREAPLRYLSTRGGCPPADLATALLTGLAPDGGLYVPETLPPAAELGGPAGLADRAAHLLSPFVSDLSPTELGEVTAEALDFPIPLVRLDDETHLLELFHGPTLAFKDVGARFMARLLARLTGDGSRRLTVLVATSGDTGSAVAQAFAGVHGIRVAILYPRGRVSELQERQLTTAGPGVLALAVEGDFDDCQRLVKAAFADRSLGRDLGLTSANSINIGRLLPQIVYYFHAAAQLPDDSAPPTFSTPSGNFGNLTAGLMARALGLPCRGFIAATNLNDSVPRYLEDGSFAPRPARQTLSSAMDVGRPSNFDRMRWLFHDDLEAMRAVVRGSAHDDDATTAIIREIHETSGILLDPHTAVGLLGVRAARAGGDLRGPAIVLATAHPAKFAPEIERVLGIAPEMPRRLARCLEREGSSRPLAADSAALAAVLREEG